MKVRYFICPSDGDYKLFVVKRVKYIFWKIPIGVSYLCDDGYIFSSDYKPSWGWRRDSFKDRKSAEEALRKFLERKQKRAIREALEEQELKEFRKREKCEEVVV